MTEFVTPQFWIAVLEIIVVNILLSGDNAVVIALAARSLPPRQQMMAVGWGSGAFSELIVERAAPAVVEGIDPSEPQLAFARSRPVADTIQITSFV